MKTGTLVNRFVLTLITLAFFINGASGQSLTLNDIPDQTINLGQSFSTINLDDYINVPSSELHKIEWTASGENQLSVSIDNGRKANVVPVSDTWTGSETITFHAMDTDLNTGSDAATFTIQQAVNAAPVVSDIPDQEHAEGEGFQSVNLDDFVTDADNTDAELTWSASGNSALSVNINPTSHTAIINVPNADWNGTETIVFKATDPESAASEDAATFTLTPVNDAPVISDIPNQSVNEGESFSTIDLDTYVTDVDNSKSELTWNITGNTNLTPSVNDAHIATINKPANWSGSEKLTFSVKDPSDAGASDDATFEVKAVNAAPVAVNDNYSTTQGGTLNIAAPGVLSNDSDADLDPFTAVKVTDPSHGTLTLNPDGSFNYVNDGTPFSSDAFTYKASDGTNESDLATVTIDITLVNAAPVLGGIEGSAITYTEGDGAVNITNTITITDSDNPNMASATVTISGNYQNGEDVLSFTNANGISGSWNATAGRLTLTGNATVAFYQTALRSVQYTNNSVTPSNLARTITFLVNDGTDNSNTQGRNINVSGSNSAPVLGAIEGAVLSYAEGDGAVNITNTITITDGDNTSMASAVVTISSNYQNGEDVLSFTNTASITGTWNAASGQLSLSGSATIANYRTALRSVRYTNSSLSPSNLARTVSFQVSDGTDNSNTLTRNISVTGTNSLPLLASIEGSALAYTEGAGEVNITGTITATDADNTNLASAVITISTNYQNGEDVLSFTNANGISGSWNAATGQLSLNGNTTVANYRTALRSVKYANNSTTPSNLTRTVTFRVNDGTDNSNTLSRNITVTGSNDAPVLSGIETPALNYTEGDGAVNITGTIQVTDGDNVNLSSALITISANYQNGEDVLSFTNAFGITGSWNGVTGQLSLTGNATVANYRSALRSVRYTNNSTNPSNLTRTVTFRVNDGTENSNTQSRSIIVVNLSSAPVLDAIEVTSLPYTEGNAPVSITSTLTVADADDANLAFATVTITGNYQNGEDVLSFTNANGITAAWSAATGQLTLSGSSSVANYQSALRSVKYNNTSTNPNIAARNIAFRVNDGTSNSNLQNRSITLTAVNNAPVLAAIEATDLDYTEGDGPVSVSGTITVTDNDNLTLQSAVITISANYKNTEDILSYTNANGITGSWNATTGVLTLTGNVSPANFQSALRSVKYTNTSSNPNILDRTVTFRVSDGTLNSNVLSRNIKITRTGVYSSSISGSASYCPLSVMPIVLTVTDGTAPFTATLTRSGSTANKDTVITGIAASPYTINVKLTGSYILTKLTDLHNEEAAVTATPVVLAAYPKPKGVLSGPSTVCNDGQTVQISLNLSGSSPWTYTVRRGGGNDTTFTGVTSDPHSFTTRIISSPMTVRLVSISDAHCTGDTIGSGTVRVAYLPSPTASIQGQDTICPGDIGKLKVTITGTSGPWSITYLRDGANPIVVNSVTTSPYTLNVQGTGTYSLSKVQQLNGGCTGKLMGTGKVIPYTVPTATLSGTSTFCEFASGNLNVNLTGNSPWKFSYKRNSESPVEVLNVSSSPNSIPINRAGTYTLFEVFDENCKGTTSGSANVTITPAPSVTLSGLAPAYDKDYDQMVSISGSPSGGTFTGPGLFNSGSSWYFLPRYAPVGTHQVVYSYKDGSTQCFGYDTATVRVLEANAIVEFPEDRLKYCLNDLPFTVTGVNLADNIGSFTISGETGLTDHGDNTATVDPSQLSAKDYTITYTYFDGTTLNVKSTFEVGKSPTADFKWESECFAPEQSINFKDASAANFGSINAYHWKVYTSTGFDTASTPEISHTFPQPGNHVIELQVETTNGCSGSVAKVFGLRPTITPKGVDGIQTETFENAPLSWRSATLQSPATNSWTLGNPDGPTGIIGAYSDTTCWYTNLSAYDAPPREQSWVSSPCYDFTGMERPMVKMQMWRDFNGRRDGAVLQATTDSAKNWFNIGQMDDGKNWYNQYSILGNPGGQQIGWSDKQDGGWIEARHSLDMLKGNTRIQFRIAYGSDGTVQNTDGFAFDDFWIGERDRKVLIEHFTNTSDAASEEADAELNEFVNADSLNTIDLQYHTSFPGYDPFNAQEPFGPSARLLYYGISDVPYAILNGGYEPNYRITYEPAHDLNPNVIHLESLEDADFGLKFLSSSFENNHVNFVVEIDPKVSLPPHEYTIHAGVYERKVVGTDNGKTYENVVRVLLPDPAGKIYSGSWSAGSQIIEEFSWDVPDGINSDQLMVFAFMQDEESHEVYQVSSIKVGKSDIIGVESPEASRDKFIVFPNPARDQVFVRFDRPVRGEARIDMFNNLGSLVYTGIIPQTDTDTEIMTDKYPDGLYIIRITVGNEILGVTKLNITR